MNLKALPIAAALFAVALMATNSAPASAAGLLAQTRSVANNIDNNVGKMAGTVEQIGFRKHRHGFRGGRHYHGRSFHHGRYIGGHYYGGRHFKHRRHFKHKRHYRHRGHFGRSGLRTQRRSGFYIGPGFNRGFGFRGGQK